MDNIDVVAIALFSESSQKFLIVRRGPGESGAGNWEFPGGKIENQETHIQALAREVDEELSLAIDPKALVFIASNLHQYSSKAIHLHLYAYIVGSEVDLVLVDHDESAWVTVHQLSKFSLAAADVPFIPFLEKWVLNQLS